MTNNPNNNNNNNNNNGVTTGGSLGATCVGSGISSSGSIWTRKTITNSSLYSTIGGIPVNIVQDNSDIQSMVVSAGLNYEARQHTKNEFLVIRELLYNRSKIPDSHVLIVYENTHTLLAYLSYITLEWFKDLVYSQHIKSIYSDIWQFTRLSESEVRVIMNTIKLQERISNDLLVDKFKEITTRC